MGLNPEFFIGNLREIKHNKDYGSKYSCIYFGLSLKKKDRTTITVIQIVEIKYI